MSKCSRMVFSAIHPLKNNQKKEHTKTDMEFQPYSPNKMANGLQIWDPPAWAYSRPVSRQIVQKKVDNMWWLLGLIGATILLGLGIIVLVFLNDCLTVFFFGWIIQGFHRMNPNP